MFNFDEWFYSISPTKPGFWQRSGQKYCRSVSKGSPTKTLETATKAMAKAIKAPTLEGMPKITSPEEFAHVCDMALDAQKKYFDHAEKAKEWVPSFPKVTTWFNDRRWEAQIGSHTELLQKATYQPKIHKATEAKGDKKVAQNHLRLVRGALGK